MNKDKDGYKKPFYDTEKIEFAALLHECVMTFGLSF
jgi:hypothetical protein